MEEKKKTPKEFIAEGAVTGGLTNEDVRQHYKINYMLPYGQYEPKLELALLLMKENRSKPDEMVIQSYRSLRFNNSAQIRMFILNMIKAYFFWQKKEGQVRPDNFDYKLQKFLEDAEGVIRHPENYQ